MATNCKCKDCGWLGVRLKDTRALVDAEEAYRHEGFIARRTGGGGRPETVIESLPMCFADVRDFYGELRTPSPDEGKVKAALDKLLEVCKEFEQWHPGISPKEMQEMKFLKEQRDWQQQESNANARWRWLELFVMGVLVTAVSAIVQIGAALVERGSLLRDKPPPVAVNDPARIAD